MAETVHLYLKANGADVMGESSQRTLGRENSIECLFYEANVVTARDPATGMATGRRKYEPIVIRKRIDKSTPLLYKALAQNTVVTGTFKFFRPNPNGDGTTQQFYTVHFEAGRIAGLRQLSPDSFDPALANRPPLEEISFVFGTIKWTYEQGGVEHQDSWMNGA